MLLRSARNYVTLERREKRNLTVTYSGREWQVRAESLSAFFKPPRNRRRPQCQEYACIYIEAVAGSAVPILFVGERFFIRVSRSDFKDSKHRVTQIFVKLRSEQSGGGDGGGGHRS